MTSTDEMFLFRRLVRFLIDRRKLAKKAAFACASTIHGPVCMFAISTRAVPGVRKSKGVPIATMPRHASGAAVESLERLERTAESSEYLWGKAWLELSPRAYQAILNNGKPVPLVNGTPSPAMIMPLIPAAKAIARKGSRAKSERNHAVLSILSAYRKAFGRPTPAPALKFIGDVETIYADMIPNGFGIDGSHSKLEALIKSLP